MAEHGVAFLINHHWDKEQGGFYWVLKGTEIHDDHKWCYSAAFGLLAIARAAQIGIPLAEKLLPRFLFFVEDTYFEPKVGLYIDSFNRDFSIRNEYRGQNANMHMCEAMIAVYECTNERQYLIKAINIARKLTNAAEMRIAKGVVCEHFTSDW